MSIDESKNLLHDLVPNYGREDWRTSDFELLQVLQQHFRSAQSEGGSQEVIFPNLNNPELRATFNGNGRLVALNAMPSLTEAALASIRDRVKAELLEATGVATAREIFFSLAPVQGWWKYHDRFRILPVPADAPRPDFLYAQHPFLLEFSYNSAADPFTDHARRCRETWPIHQVLNALLTTPVWWGGGKTVGTNGRSWVLLPFATDPPEWNVRYLQHSYGYKGFAPTSDDYSVMDEIEPIPSVSAENYYGDPYRTTGDALVFPDDLGESFDMFFQASALRRRQFLRASYWLSQVNKLDSFSLSFICAIQAIDAILPPAPSGVRCKECGLEKRPSRTALFVDFLSRFAPSPTVTDADRRALFSVRSQLSHGFRDPLNVDKAAGFGLNPEDHEERTQGSRAIQTARIAIYNWLHSTEFTANE